MTKTNLGIIILLGISIVGLVWLITIDKSTDLLTPIITALLGLLVGVNKEPIIKIFKK